MMGFGAIDSGRIGDGWDAVPKYLIEDVRAFMADNGLKPSEYAEDLQDL
jgi:hypothetical protein